MTARDQLWHEIFDELMNSFDGEEARTTDRVMAIIRDARWKPSVDTVDQLSQEQCSVGPPGGGIHCVLPVGHAGRWHIWEDGNGAVEGWEVSR